LLLLVAGLVVVADVRLIVVVAVFPFASSDVRIGFTAVKVVLVSFLAGIEMVAGPTVGVFPLETNLVVTTGGGDGDRSFVEGD